MKKITNNPDLWKTFVAYTEERIQVAQRSMEQATDIQEIYRHQGAIRELRKQLKLRDNLNAE